MQYPTIPLAQTLILLFKAKEIQHIVISPGSRNAPATIGFTQDRFFKCYSIVDERCAAFFALGIAQQINKPVAVVCTSGSALLNYYPAVSEAFFSNIPLVVLSADRPAYLVGIGDGQTINQRDVYKNHVIYTANLKAQQDLELAAETTSTSGSTDHLASLDSEMDALQKQNEIEINNALNAAISKGGPVHINAPFHEPLYHLTDTLAVNPQIIPPFKQSGAISLSKINDHLNIWNKATRKMILVGVNPPNSIEQQWLNQLAADPSVIVFTETTSNIHHPAFFNSIDTIIASLNDADFKALQPEVLLTFGGLIVSKKIKAFLRNYKPKTHWHVDLHQANNTFFCLQTHFKTTPNQFFKTFLPETKKSVASSYQRYWQDVKTHRLQRHDLYLKEIGFSDFIAFHTISKSLPTNSILHLGNSSTIRYSQLFKIAPEIPVYCNRGTSGIDGSTSTALGGAVVQDKQTVFITGDLSFFYDSNALWNNYIPSNFRILIINNQGGGIFRILPGHKNSENFDNFFETTHNHTAKQLAEMYNFQYQTAHTNKELVTVLQDFYEASDKPKILEIFTPRTDNDKILLDYFKFVS
ncbi:2-succinyl-5-enolpyruvyl-6-hydroxy-3-cyclohexene-1-carboxylic-acid synthase [Bizionia sediminis]|uniref:2-succinyl-5-enolpyruvyl-6-hydroxy-3-cyclohexene-1-carboxylate synthase n=1 Tax=Bizionia sediminis TaxID=1737064 RepID=A0ABW5KP01_9FLAO